MSKYFKKSFDFMTKMKMRKLFLILILFFSFQNLYAQIMNDSCYKAMFFCGEPFSYPAATEGPLWEPGPDYDCLNFFPVLSCVRWFYFKALTSGWVSLQFSTPFLLDWMILPLIIWGGFPSTEGVCVEGLTGDKVVFCDDNPSTPFIASFEVTEGEYYYMFIHHPLTGSAPFYPYLVFIEQVYPTPPGGPWAELDCSPLSNQDCIFNFIYPDTSECDTSTNTFSISGDIGYTYPPDSGVLIVKDLPSNLTDTIKPPFEGLNPFLIENIPCDGQIHYLSAWFTAGNCSLLDSLRAPLGDCAIGTMTGGGNYCQPNGPPVEVYISVAGGLPPYSFSWAIDGIPQPEVSGYTGPWPYVIQTTQTGIYSLLSMSGSDCPGTAFGTATVTASMQPTVFLNDTSACEGTAVVLDAGSGFVSYLWNTGEQTQSIVVTAAATYSVTVTDANGCEGSGQATVSFLPRPAPNPIKHD